MSVMAFCSQATSLVAFGGYKVIISLAVFKIATIKQLAQEALLWSLASREQHRKHPNLATWPSSPELGYTGPSSLWNSAAKLATTQTMEPSDCGGKRGKAQMKQIFAWLMQENLKGIQVHSVMRSWRGSGVQLMSCGVGCDYSWTELSSFRNHQTQLYGQWRILHRQAKGKAPVPPQWPSYNLRLGWPESHGLSSRAQDCINYRHKRKRGTHW